MKKLLLIFLLISSVSFSQEIRKIFYGIISDDLGTLPRAHVINTKTKKVTYSNDKGEFKVFAQLNDSLKFTSVGYKNKFLKVNSSHFGMSENKIHLDKEIVELDEIEVKNNDLTGNLTTDIKKIPKDYKTEALEKLMDFSDIDMNAPMKADHIDAKVRPHIVNTDPVLLVPGFGVGATIPFGYSEKLWALRREIAFKQSFPSKLLSEFGKPFFFEELKIPKEKFLHFLDYCNQFDIEDLYRKDKKLELIKTLRTKSILFLKK